MISDNRDEGSMTDAQRVRRIAELLCKAVMLAEAKRAVASSTLEFNSLLEDPAGLLEPRKTDDDRVLRYIQIAGQASPVAIRTALGLSRSAAYRALTRLAINRQVVSAGGQGRLLVYRLNQAEPSPEQIALN